MGTDRASTGPTAQRQLLQSDRAETAWRFSSSSAPSIRALCKRILARCKIGVLVSGGAATRLSTLSTPVPLFSMEVGLALNAVTGTRRLGFCISFLRTLCLYAAARSCRLLRRETSVKIAVSQAADDRGAAAAGRDSRETAEACGCLPRTAHRLE
jgi:hypothetical protein